jgi:hypothetical protein
MQAVQAAIIAAAAAASEVAAIDAPSSNGGSNGDGGSTGVQRYIMSLDRTERLSSSLGKMVWTVEQLNDIPHDFGIMLMAGRSLLLSVVFPSSRGGRRRAWSRCGAT